MQPDARSIHYSTLIKKTLATLALVVAGFFLFFIVVSLLRTLGLRLAGDFFFYVLMILGLAAPFIISRKLKPFHWYWFGEPIYREPSEAKEETPLTPRKTPQGTEIVLQSPEKSILKVKSAIRFWFVAAPVVGCVIGLLAGGLIGAVLGYTSVDSNTLQGQMQAPLRATLWATVLSVIGLLVGFAAGYVLSRPWVTIVVLPDRVKYGSKVFDRRFHDAVTVGYSFKTQSSELKNSFHDISLGLAGLRFEYGPWGEDLPYLVNKYHSSEIVIWLNHMIRQVGAPTPRAHAPTEGRKEQSF